jgi:hypothetical protein
VGVSIGVAIFNDEDAFAIPLDPAVGVGVDTAAAAAAAAAEGDEGALRILNLCFNDVPLDNEPEFGAAGVGGSGP